MKIERAFIETSDIADFADKHGLVMVVNERPTNGRDRFYASFRGVEIMDGGCLVGAFSNGATENDAIAAYAERLSLQQIAIFSGMEERTNVRVPRLRYTPKECK